MRTYIGTITWRDNADELRTYSIVGDELSDLNHRLLDRIKMLVELKKEGRIRKVEDIYITNAAVAAAERVIL